MQYEPVVQGRVPDRLFELNASLQRFVHLQHEEADTITPGSLAIIERKIGVLEQTFRGLAVCRRYRDTDRDINSYFPLLESHRLAQHRRNSPRKILGLLFAGYSRLNNHKFVAAEPGYHVLDARECAQALTKRAEQKVAAGVTERVVDLLESVDIKKVHDNMTAGRR